METIGWIGTGLLGTALVKRLLTQQVAVMVFNRTREKAQALTEHGAVVVSSPCALAKACTTIFLCLTGHTAIEEVLFNSEQGIVAAGVRNICIFDVSTVSPGYASSLATRLQDLGIHYIDAPVSGGPENALLGKMACLLSGSRIHVEQHRELIENFAASIHYIGSSGSAQLLKILNNLAESINLAGAAELLSIGLKAGIDLDTLHTVLPTMRGYSTYMGVLLDRLAHPSSNASFTLASRLKDIKLAHQVANDYTLPIPMGGLVEQLFALALKQEGPLADQTACIRLYHDE